MFRGALAALAVALALSPAASAQLPEPPAEKSDNVSWVTTLDASSPANAGQESRIAERTSGMPVAEPLALPASSGRAWVATFGQLCRAPVSD